MVTGYFNLIMMLKMKFKKIEVGKELINYFKRFDISVIPSNNSHIIKRYAYYTVFPGIAPLLESSSLI